MFSSDDGCEEEADIFVNITYPDLYNFQLQEKYKENYVCISIYFNYILGLYYLHTKNNCFLYFD